MTLRAGGVDLGYVNNSTIGNGPMPPVGGWSTARGYFTANHKASLGSALQIRLLPVGTPNQSNYDNVRLWKLTGAAILLNNPSFEMDDVPAGGSQMGAFGWVASGNAGVYQGSSEITPADGVQSAYVTGGASLTQTLAGVPLRNDYVYILMVDVADRRSTTFAGYQVELLAGGQTLAMDNNSLLVPQATDTVGYFYTTAVVQFRGIDHPLAGQDLGIRLTALGTPSNQTYFDNVRLFAYWVPEPSSWSLLGLAGAMLLVGWGRRFRRQRNGD
ncbi:MAG TPA: PEP-CTERM sorting domain-containing protein, partial [Thermoguttaceae bacterium]|nr:PEP-CTERM sorting domain-containing protein [Thermoguttaceae bacterium]